MKHWIDYYSCILCDLDGCIVSGQTLLPGAQDFCKTMEDRLVIISNNSSDTPESLTQKLLLQDLQISAERVLLAGTTTLELLADQRPGTSVKIYGSDDLKDYAFGLNLTFSYTNPEAIVLTRDTQFSYSTLNDIIRKLSRGAELWVSNLDDSHPGIDGYPVAETGALFHAVMTCMPDIVYQSVGKPNSHLYEIANKRFGFTPSETIVIGDNPDTDMYGAQKYGLDYVMLDASGSGFGPDNLFQLLEQKELETVIQYPGVSIRMKN